MKRLLPLLALAALIVAGCRISSSTVQAPPAVRNELIVSAAVSLKDAFTEIGRLYETRTGTHVNFNFGASGILQKQIEQAAPVDVFASAGARQMAELATKGFVLTDTQHIFASNILVLIKPGQSSDHNTPDRSHTFAALLEPDVRRIAIGNPKTVPAGQYTEQLLNNMKLWDRVQPKLVFAEDVRQVYDYVARGEVDAGVVYSSDAAALHAPGVYVYAEATQQGLHDPIVYPVAVVKDSQHADAARQFVAFVLSPEGQNILTKYGFIHAPPTGSSSTAHNANGSAQS